MQHKQETGQHSLIEKAFNILYDLLTCVKQRLSPVLYKLHIKTKQKKKIIQTY